MRLAVLADIHGNLPALEAVMADVKRQGVDGLIVAGDFCDRPQPLEAVRAVQALGACAIRGNRENYLLAYHRLGCSRPLAHRQAVGRRALAPRAPRSRGAGLYGFASGAVRLCGRAARLLSASSTLRREA